MVSRNTLCIGLICRLLKKRSFFNMTPNSISDFMNVDLHRFYFKRL